MKRILMLSAVITMMILTASCGRKMYSTTSSGKDEVSYVSVIKESGNKYDKVEVIVDGVTHEYGKIYKVKMKRKTSPVVITPGKHDIKVVADGQVVFDQNVFIGLQETVKVVLK